VEVWPFSFLTRAPDERKWIATRPTVFIPEERTTDTHWVEMSLALKTFFYALTKRKVLFLRRILKMDSAVAQPVL
jgi:hypothetical protein